MSFLALDAMLGWKVKHYESSWLEWGNLSNEEGTLTAGSPWRTNNTTYTEALNESVSTNSSPPAGCSNAASASATNDNDKQICTGAQTYDCNGDIN